MNASYTSPRVFLGGAFVVSSALALGLLSILAWSFSSDSPKPAAEYTSSPAPDSFDRREYRAHNEFPFTAESAGAQNTREPRTREALPRAAELAAIAADPAAAPHLRTAAARALAEIDSDAARALTRRLARNLTDPITARSTVRGIAAQGDRDSEETLAELLFDPEAPESVRMEAARGLAEINSPEALQTLLRATWSEIDSHPSEPVLHEVLRGVAREKPQAANGFIQNVLNHPDLDAASKIAAIEALRTAKGENVIPLLLEQTLSDNTEIREAAIWAIAGHEDVHRAKDTMWDLFEYEDAPEVRANLYEALRSQDDLDVERAWRRIMKERVPIARLAGMNLIADHLHKEILSRFEAEVVPELSQIATDDPSLSNRISAIVALGRAEKSPAATDTLRSLVDQDSTDGETRRAAELALGN